MTAKKKRTAFISTRETALRTCPVCQRVLSAATSVSLDAEESRPQMQAGHVTCCFYCGTILLVTPQGFRPATEAEALTLDATMRAILFEWDATMRAILFECAARHQKGAQ